MSSSWGWTEMVLEGGAANDVYALLSRAKEECASEERDHCSQVIHTVKGDFCFALGLDKIFEDTGDSYWGPAVKETVLREDVFMLFPYPFDRSYKERNGYQLPAIHRLDMGVTYTFKMGKLENKVNLSVYNVYNRQNISNIFWGYDSHKLGAKKVLKGVCLLPILPSISYTLKL